MMIRLLFLLFPLLGIFSASKPAEDQPQALVLKMKIIGVKDGDTVEGLYYQMPVVIRLEHIDAPEKKQAFGTASKQKLSDLVFGKTVTVRSRGAKGNFDRNGRMVAELTLESGVNANKEMVKAGMAWHFKKYSSSQEYAALEEIARKNAVGLWRDKNVQSPWDFRKK